MTAEALERLLIGWRKKPSKFVSDVFAPKFKDDQQKILDLFSSDNPRTRVCWKGYRGAGKTAVEAWLGLMFPVIWDNASVITTSGTWRQVTQQQWREMTKWYRIAGARGWNLGPEPLTVEWRPRKTSFAVGCSVKDPNKIKGYHNRRILSIVDEACIVPESVQNAMDGYRQSAEVCQELAAGTAEDADTWFASKFASDDWVAVTTDGETAKDCDAAWREECARAWGKTSILYLSQVRAQFYRGGTDALCQPAWLHVARSGLGDAEVSGTDGYQFGVDVGAGGDLSALVVRAGHRVVFADTCDKEDTMQTVGMVSAAARDYDPRVIVVDASGVGKGTVDRLRELGFPVSEYFAGANAADKERFRMRRDEDYWGVRTRLSDEDLDLSAVPEPFYKRLLWQLTNIQAKRISRGQMILEDKKTFKARMRKEKGPDFARSPDEADALTMAFCEAEPEEKFSPEAFDELELVSR